jgi:hypothetical protein
MININIWMKDSDFNKVLIMYSLSNFLRETKVINIKSKNNKAMSKYKIKFSISFDIALIIYKIGVSIKSMLLEILALISKVSLDI